MNLRALVNPATSVINPNIILTVNVYSGTTIGAGAKQIPSYTSTTGRGQLQALDNSDLKLIDGLNIQGDIRALYLYGSVSGTLRPDSKGNDTVTIGAEMWKVVKVLETWPDWSRSVIVKQGGL